MGEMADLVLEHIAEQVNEYDRCIDSSAHIRYGMGHIGEYGQTIGNPSSTPFMNTKKVCSKCGGKVVLKRGKYGNFYGCASFPKCNGSAS